MFESILSVRAARQPTAWFGHRLIPLCHLSPSSEAALKEGCEDIPP